MNSTLGCHQYCGRMDDTCNIQNFLRKKLFIKFINQLLHYLNALHFNIMYRLFTSFMSDHDVETNVLSNLMHIVILIIVWQICIFQVIHWIFPPYYVQIITTFFNKKLGQINVIVPCLFIATHVVQVNLTQF